MENNQPPPGGQDPPQPSPLASTPPGNSMGKNDESGLPSVVPASASADAPMPRFMIEIAGTACSGKSTLAILLAQVLAEFAPLREPVDQNNGPVVPILPQQLYSRPESQLMPVFLLGGAGGDRLIKYGNRDLLESCSWEKLELDFNTVRASGTGHVGFPDATFPSDIDDWIALQQALVRSDQMTPVLHRARSMLKQAIEIYGPRATLGADEFPGRYFGPSHLGRLGVHFGIIEGGQLVAKPHHPTLRSSASDQASQLRIENGCDLKLFCRLSRKMTRQRFVTNPSNQDPPNGARGPGQWWKSVEYFDSVTLPRSEINEMPIKDAIPVSQRPDGGKVNGFHVKGTRSQLDLSRTVAWALKIVIEELKKREARERENWQQMHGLQQAG